MRTELRNFNRAVSCLKLLCESKSSQVNEKNSFCFFLACEDTFEWCKMNKAKICTPKKEFSHYLPRCLATCEKCEKTSGHGGKCKDLAQWCPKYKERVCNNSALKRKYGCHCMKTCGECTPRNKCSDLAKWCVRYKKKVCKIPVLRRKYLCQCMKTCGVC